MRYRIYVYDRYINLSIKVLFLDEETIEEKKYLCINVNKNVNEISCLGINVFIFKHIYIFFWEKNISNATYSWSDCMSVSQSYLVNFAVVEHKWIDWN